MRARVRSPWLFVGLIVLVVFTFWHVTRFEFVSWDDNTYVTDNPQVRAGLTTSTVAWAFTTTNAPYWHPLTWLSHAIDVELFGLDAGAHHATSVLIHLANTLLLFVLLARMTGATGRSAAVAALFAVHPMHVESVAWVAERKDVLSTCFLLATVAAYVSYVRSPRWPRYLLVVAAYTARADVEADGRDAAVSASAPRHLAAAAARIVRCAAACQLTRALVRKTAAGRTRGNRFRRDRAGASRGRRDCRLDTRDGPGATGQCGRRLRDATS